MVKSVAFTGTVLCSSSVLLFSVMDELDSYTHKYSAKEEEHAATNPVRLPSGTAFLACIYLQLFFVS